MILDVLAKKKIDYRIPVFTLDVNQVALKDPNLWPPQMDGLAELEYNYFNNQRVELCVTPETSWEIAKDTPVSSLGTIAYARFQKSELFKLRPPGTILDLSGDEPNMLWNGIRHILFPSVTDELLTRNQIADISQMFYHSTASGSISNSAFLTADENFHAHSDELKEKLGIQVMYPKQAWNDFYEPYNLYRPEKSEIDYMIKEQREYLRRLREESQRGY